MKFIKMAAIAIVLATVFVACSKDKNDAPFVIEGTWKGTTGSGGFFGVNLKPGGVLERIYSNGSVGATGTWQLNGKTLTGEYHFVSGTDVTMSATVDTKHNKFSGNWSNDVGETGTMEATKAN
jgi:hypothetical protein